MGEMEKDDIERWRDDKSKAASSKRKPPRARPKVVA